MTESVQVTILVQVGHEQWTLTDGTITEGDDEHLQLAELLRAAIRELEET